MIGMKAVQRAFVLFIGAFALFAPSIFFMLKDHIDEHPERWIHIKRLGSKISDSTDWRRMDNVVEVPDWSLHDPVDPKHEHSAQAQARLHESRSVQVDAELRMSRQIRKQFGRIALEVNSNTTARGNIEIRDDDTGFQSTRTGEAADLLPTLDQRLAATRSAIRRSVEIMGMKPADTERVEQQVNVATGTVRPPPVDAKPQPPQPMVGHAVLPSDSARNLVLTSSVGVHDANLAVFLGSLRAAAPSCTIVLFGETFNPRMQTLFSQLRVRAVPVPPEQREQAWTLFHIFLRDKKQDFDKVLVASASDTVFQSQPFAIAQDPGVYVTEEGTPLRLWGDGVMGRCLGEGVARELGEKRALWSHSLLGSAAAVAAVLEGVAALQLGEPYKRCLPEARSSPLQDPPRAALNAVLHRLAPPFHLLHPQDSPVALLDLKAAKVNADGKSVTNRNTGANPPIVHQYEHDKLLLASLITAYVPFALQAESDGAGDCAGYKLLSDVDAFDGFGDLTGPETAGSAQECCKICTARRPGGCKAFTFLGKARQCWLKGMPSPKRDGPAIPDAVSAWLPGSR